MGVSCVSPDGNDHQLAHSQCLPKSTAQQEPGESVFREQGRENCIAKRLAKPSFHISRVPSAAVRESEVLCKTLTCSYASAVRTLSRLRGRQESSRMGVKQLRCRVV